VLVEAEPGKPVSAESIPLERGRKIRRGSFDSLEKALLWLGEHHEDYVEVTMEVDNYLEAGVRDAILEAHPRVLAVVPEIRDREALFDGKRKEMDLHAPVASLFIEYFRSRNGGADPEPELVGLLSEALAAAGAEEES
jgi:exonuclease SbcD